MNFVYFSLIGLINFLRIEFDRNCRVVYSIVVIAVEAVKSTNQIALQTAEHYLNFQ